VCGLCVEVEGSNGSKISGWLLAQSWRCDVVDVRSGRNLIDQSVADFTVTDDVRIFGQGVHLQNPSSTLHHNLLLLCAVWPRSVIESRVSSEIFMIQSHVSLACACKVVANCLANYRVIDSNAVAIVVERGKLAELSRVDLSDTHFCPARGLLGSSLAIIVLALRRLGSSKQVEDWGKGA
jgi:hypothetical protein